jgi:hypothetical protein
MNKLIIYAILGVAIGILVYMFSCEIRKTFLISKYNNYVAKFGETSNETIDDDSIPTLILKNDTCTNTIKKIETAINTIQKRYENEKAAKLKTLKQCNSTVDSKMAILQNYLDKITPGVTADKYMEMVDKTFDRNKFK